MDSAQLARLVDAARERDIGIHHLFVVRHGYVVLDTPFFPHDGNAPHDVASCTKSIVSTAVGRAYSEDRIASMTDPLLGFFPGETPKDADARKRAMTLEHALTMKTGLACEASPTEQTLLLMQRSENWNVFTLALPMEGSPGAEWKYCSPVSHLLSGVVTASTGATAEALLTESVFKPIGIGKVLWPKDPRGLSIGYGDLRMHAEDLARIGFLYLHDGEWDGVRILNEAWLKSALEDHSGLQGPDRDGYGYQWWTTNDGAFYASGRGGQFLFVHPAADLIVVTLGGARPRQIPEYVALLHDQLLPAIHSEEALPENMPAVAHLQRAIAAAQRAPTPRAPEPMPDTARLVSGRSYAIDTNTLGWMRLAIAFGMDQATLTLTLAGSTQKLMVGLDGVPRVTHGVRMAEMERYHDVNVALSGHWVDEGTFSVAFDTIDRIDAGTMTFRFAGDLVQVETVEETFVDAHATLSGRAD